jgi:excisionase family DNA binding protein
VRAASALCGLALIHKVRGRWILRSTACNLLSKMQGKRRGGRVSLIKVYDKRTLERLKQALRAHHQALEELESALLEFEESISGEAALRPQEDGQRGGVQLLSIPQLCQELGMGKSWIYRRLRSGEIPSVRLGRSIKVKREDIEEYLESRRHRPPSA